MHYCTLCTTVHYSLHYDSGECLSLSCQVIIAGNHDLTFDTDNYDSLWRRFSHPQKYNSQELKDSIARVENVTYLEDSGTTINGIRIWGSPW